jgi:hypothetical protein
MESKSAFKSKTVIFNLVSIGVLILGIYGIEVDEQTQQALIGGIAAVISVGNLILRKKTSQPIHIKKPKEQKDVTS